MEGAGRAFEMFWIALVASGFASIPLMPFLRLLKSRQTISAYVPEHAAKQGTPTMGGLITVVGAGVALACAGPMARFAWECLVLFLAFAGVGFIDDYLVPRLIAGKRGLGWKQKILMELLLAGGPILLFESVPLWSLALGVFLILFFSNAFNFTDGLDGLAGTVGLGLLGGLAAIACISVGFGTADLALPSVILIGALIPFLFLNAPPAKVFMGDVGSLPIGAIIGFLFWKVLTVAKAANVYSAPVALLILSLVMCAELLPVPMQIASVKLRKGKRIFAMTPIHHGFQKKGIAETRIVWHYALIQLLLAALAVTFYALTINVVSIHASVQQ